VSHAPVRRQTRGWRTPTLSWRDAALAHVPPRSANLNVEVCRIEQLPPCRDLGVRSRPHTNVPGGQDRSCRAGHLYSPPPRVWEAQTRRIETRTCPAKAEKADSLAGIVSPRPDGDEGHAFGVRENRVRPHGDCHRMTGDRRWLESEGRPDLCLGDGYE
jgi:hypothetical protein